MNTATSSLDTVTSGSRAAQLGLFVIGFLGFSHMEVVHNAGHDYRHSMAFPCH
jgi:cobalt transporter subunit CbtB